MEDDNGGLFNIEVSSEDEAETKKKLPRDFQSEEEFLCVKAGYKPKIDVGELWKTLSLPVHKPSKPESQTILHAIEELYFFRRYEEALKITEGALKAKSVEEFRRTLEDYRTRCQTKIGKARSHGQHTARVDPESQLPGKDAGRKVA